MEKSSCSSALQSLFCGRSWAIQRKPVWLTGLFLSVSVKIMPAAMMQQPKKDSTNPTSFIFSLYNLGTRFLNNFQSCSEACNTNAQPQAETLLKNIWKAEYSQFIAKLLMQQEFQLADAWLSASRVTPKEYDHIGRSTCINMIHWKSTSVATVRGSLITLCRVSINLQMKRIQPTCYVGFSDDDWWCSTT